MLDRNGQMLGYFWVEVRNGSVGFLLDLYVEPSWRRRLIGMKLLNEAVRQVLQMGATELRLAVASRNKIAIDLFVAKGFGERETELREGHLWFELVERLC